MKKRAISVSLTAFAVGAGVVAACASFDESSQTPSGDDATAPDGFAGESSTAGDAAASCVPEPMGPTDAGVEDARCVPSGLEVNLSTSNEHCGFCGHVCTPNNGCAQGACTGQELSTFAELVKVGAAHTATHLYYAANPVIGCAASKVRRTELGKAGEEEVLVETGTGCIDNLRLADGHLYYLQNGVGIRRTPIDAAVPSSPPVVDNPLAVGFATTSTALFVVSTTYASITRTQLDGGAPMVIHDDGVNLLRVLAADETSVWWVTEPNDAGVGQATLWGVPPSSNTSVKRVMNLTGIRSLALDAEYIYVASTTGDVVRLMKTGASSPEPVTTIGAENTFPQGMAVVGDYLYVAVGSPGSYGPVEIYRAKKCGGRARLVARDLLAFSEMVAAGDAIYYGGGGGGGGIRLRSFEPKP